MLIAEQNVEITRTNLRADLVYLIQYRGGHHILDLELQTDADSDMAYRMLLYHVELYGKYRRRSKTMSIQDKQIVEDRLHAYDSLLDEDPEIKERIARGKIEERQRAVIEFIEARFPALVEVAQEQVVRLNKPDELSRLTKQIALAPDEATARWVLSTFAA